MSSHMLCLWRPVRWTPILLAVVLCSCGGGAPKLYPAHGKVLFRNAPATGAVVVFHPSDPAAPKPSGTVGPDGTFTLSTYPYGEGAPPGAYTVVVTWFPDNAREQEAPRNKLPNRYANVLESPLKETLTAGPNELKEYHLAK